MRVHKSTLVILSWILIIIAGLALMIVRASRFEDHCHDLGGTYRMLGGRDQHMLCISPDGRLLDER